MEVGICGRLGHHDRNNNDYVDVFQKEEMAIDVPLHVRYIYDQASESLILFTHLQVKETLLKVL